MTPQVALSPGKVAVGIAKGVYTEIVAIDAPSGAVAGETVPVTIKIENLWTDYVRIYAIGVADTEDRFIDWLDAWIPAGSTHSFSGSFIMPARDVTIHAYSYYEAADGYLYFDDEAAKDVSLEEEVIVGWQPLDTRLASVRTILPEVGWQLLDSRALPIALAPTVVGWQLLDSRTIAIKAKPPVIGWQPLDEKAVALTAGPPEEIPPEYELIQHTISHFAYIYDGDVEVTTATFKIDPFTPSAWAAKKFADALESEARKTGARVLETKVYVDTTPLLWTNIRIEVIGTPLGETVEASAGIAAIGIPIWLAIVLVCLAIIAVIVVATLMWERFQRTFKRYPELEQVKPAWGKEALILDIQDAEEHWERSLTPVETLEGMSEAELRDLLDQIAEEEFPPVAEFPVAMAIIGALVVLGGGAALAFAAEPRE